MVDMPADQVQHTSLSLRQSVKLSTVTVSALITVNKSTCKESVSQSSAASSALEIPEQHTLKSDESKQQKNNLNK